MHFWSSSRWHNPASPTLVSCLTQFSQTGWAVSQQTVESAMNYSKQGFPSGSCTTSLPSQTRQSSKNPLDIHFPSFDLNTLRRGKLFTPSTSCIPVLAGFNATFICVATTQGPSQRALWCHQQPVWQDHCMLAKPHLRPSWKSKWGNSLHAIRKQVHGMFCKMMAIRTN